MQKINEIYNQLTTDFKKIYDKFNLVNVQNFKDLVFVDKDGKKIWTKAFVKALSDSEGIYIPEGEYYIDASLVLFSNKQIIADSKAQIILKKDSRTLLMRNDAVFDGSSKLIPKSVQKTENIFISGGIWRAEDMRRYKYGKEGVFDIEDSLHGVYCLLLFSGVKNLHLKDMKFVNAGAFSIQMGRIENFIVENIEFIDCYADGVHVNGDVKNGVIKEIHGSTGDDLVALNAYDWHNSTITNGPIENVYVDNVVAPEDKGYKAMRILPGKIPTQDGIIDCYIKNLSLSNIKGVSVFKMYLQTPSYKEKPDGTMVGDIDNVTFNNISATVQEPTDRMDNYVNADEITGHFGLFELGSNITNLTLKNIDVKINFNGYPTAHLISVGPKSCYLKEHDVELFDPYVCCNVENINYKNVVVNEKKVDNLRDYIHLTKFDRLYQTELTFGNGKVEKITKL